MNDVFVVRGIPDEQTQVGNYGSPDQVLRQLRGAEDAPEYSRRWETVTQLHEGNNPLIQIQCRSCKKILSRLHALCAPIGEQAYCCDECTKRGQE